MISEEKEHSWKFFSDLTEQTGILLLLHRDLSFECNQYFLMIEFSLFVVFDGLFCREAMPSHFKFKEYCPIVFRNLRERFGIDDHDYMVNIITDIDAITYR